IFTDGSNNGTAAVVTPDQTFTFLVPKKSAQKVELNEVLQAFVMFKDSVFNLFSDSQYIVNAIVSLEDAGRISPSSTVFSLFSTIQSLIWDRKDPFFIGHIRAHTGLPGALSLGNDLADKTTHDIHIFSTLEEATNFHK
ncbi:hypothetical protein H1C71_037400, partial [Ictidomys tridecemlineatus]